MDDLSTRLPYETTQEKAIWVSKMADTNNNVVTTIQQHVLHEHSNMTSAHGDDTVINIPLPYNSNTQTKLDLWDGSFHPISLYSSIEHLASDAKNIKDFKGIGEVL